MVSNRKSTRLDTKNPSSFLFCILQNFVSRYLLSNQLSEPDQKALFYPLNPQKRLN